MALIVVNYLSLSDEDLAWVQAIRRAHDRLFFNLIEPHLPLVFPTEAVSEEALIAHVRQHVAEVAPFELVFRCVVLGDPDYRDHAHAFLVPDEGFSDVVRLHDRLYTGLLRSELRLDLPFLPHVGVANTREPEACKAIVDAINEEDFEIRVQVDALDVIGYDGTRVWEIERIALIGGSPTGSRRSARTAGPYST